MRSPERGREVVVLGGGLAGSVASLALAEAGLPVRQIVAGPGATAMASGAFDIAAASPGVAHLPWRDPLRGEPLAARDRLALLLREAPRHPYTALYAARGHAALVRDLERAIARLRGWLEPEELELVGTLDRNRLLPMAQGTLRGVDLAWSGSAEAHVEGCRRVVVLDLPGLEGWDARGCARNLVAEITALGLGPLPVQVTRPTDRSLLHGTGSPSRVAARLDRPGGERLLRALLEGCGAPGDLVLVPQIVGLSRTRSLLGALAEEGLRVGEVLALPPHGLAGHRLQRALDRACARAGVELLRGRVTHITATEHGLRLEGAAPVPLLTDRCVVATGRFVGGGLVASARGVREPLLGLPLRDPDGRRVDGIPPHRSVRKGYASAQPLYGAGVAVNPDLSLCDGPRGIFAAGEWIGGFDPARERTGLGVALLSGLAAAEAVLGSPASGVQPRGESA